VYPPLLFLNGPRLAFGVTPVPMFMLGAIFGAVIVLLRMKKPFVSQTEGVGPQTEGVGPLIEENHREAARATGAWSGAGCAANDR
jgi:hypothetical protein